MRDIVKDFFILLLFCFIVISFWRASALVTWYYKLKISEVKTQQTIEEFFMDWGDDD